MTRPAPSPSPLPAPELSASPAASRPGPGADPWSPLPLPPKLPLPSTWRWMTGASDAEVTPGARQAPSPSPVPSVAAPPSPSSLRRWTGASTSGRWRAGDSTGGASTGRAARVPAWTSPSTGGDQPGSAGRSARPFPAASEVCAAPPSAWRCTPTVARPATTPAGPSLPTRWPMPGAQPGRGERDQVGLHRRADLERRLRRPEGRGQRPDGLPGRGCRGAVVDARDGCVGGRVDRARGLGVRA